MNRIPLLGFTLAHAITLSAQVQGSAGQAKLRGLSVPHAITHDARDVHWGPEVDGVQFGLVLDADAFSVKCDLLVRYQGKRETGSVNAEFRTEVRYESLGECYRVEPATMHYVPDEVILRGSAGGWWPKVDLGRVLKPGEELLMQRFIIPRLQHTWDEECYRLNEWPDALEVVVDNVLIHDRTVPTAMSTGRAPIRYCERENFAKRQQIAEARFFDQLLKLESPDITALCIRLVQDTVQDELVRGEAMLHLAELNTDTARDVLYAQCLQPDPQLSSLLDHYFDTGDPRAGELFHRYSRHRDPEIQRDVAYGIGAYADERYFDLLKPLRTSPDRWVREAAVDALQFFDTDDSRGLLYKSLLDSDLGVRTQAVRGLAEVGNERSLHDLANYIAKEDPRNVGYVANAWVVVEQISGRSFDRDLATLQAYLKERKQ
ncbi:MAG: HEAT repeat domain-containing protein [Flavobacteriales bacterium]|nr:HEAT repeat domain-containing protein [Flavobacteriales bacterium]